nr:ankyrin repeat domain-containing protein [Brachyspira hyodysenteriae]
MIAADNGKTEIVDYLLKNNASIKEQNVNGDTALYIASSKGYFEICEQLVKYYEINDFSGKEYDVAKEKGYSSIINLFNNKLKS